MANREDIPRTTPAEIEHLIRQIQGANLDQGSKDKIERLLRTVLALAELLGRRNISIKKLRQMIFGPRTEKHHGKKDESKKKKSEFESTENESTKASGDPDVKGEQNSAERTQKSGIAQFPGFPSGKWLHTFARFCRFYCRRQIFCFRQVLENG